MTVRRRSLVRPEVTAALRSAGWPEPPAPSNDILGGLSAVRNLVSRSVSDPDSGVTGAETGTLVPCSALFELVDEIVRFLWSARSCFCSPLRADTEIVVGRENVTVDLFDLLESVRRSIGKETLSGVLETVCAVTAVVGLGVVREGNGPRTVDDVVLRRLRSRCGVLSMDVCCFRRCDSEGSDGNGLGMARGGSVRLRSVRS